MYLINQYVNSSQISSKRLISSDYSECQMSLCFDDTRQLFIVFDVNQCKKIGHQTIDDVDSFPNLNIGYYGGDRIH